MTAHVQRRDFLQAAGVTALAAASITGDAMAQTPPAGKPAVTYDIKPLPFDPKKINGLSEKILVSHHENNYGGAVKRLKRSRRSSRRSISPARRCSRSRAQARGADRDELDDPP